MGIKPNQRRRKEQQSKVVSPGWELNSYLLTCMSFILEGALCYIGEEVAQKAMSLICKIGETIFT